MSESENPHGAVVGGFDLVEHKKVTTSEAERTLLSRPKISIRRRLAAVFALFAFGSMAMTVVIWTLLHQIEAKIELIGVAEQLNYEILQIRRFEKNFLLYGGGLEQVNEHIDVALSAIQGHLDELGVAVSSECLTFLETNLWHYQSLIGKLRSLEKSEDPATVAARNELFGKLRETGSDLVSCGQKIADTERRNVSKLLTVSRAIPVVSLLLVIALSVYGASFLWKQILQRLELLMAAARRIGAGDFSPIVPVRKYRDEFTDVAIAINRMTRELERREEYLLQSQKLRAVGSLTAGIAHEVNNPLNNIMLTAAVLQEDFDTMQTAEKQELIEDIVQQSERACKIVRNLLDFARESEISTEPLNIGNVVDAAIDLAANQLKLSGVKLVREIADDLPDVNGDLQYLSQVFLNLILNAVDAMPEGGTLTLSSDRSLDIGCVAIHVADTGTGMAPDTLQSIFDPFFTTKSSGSGTGLGLSVSLGIVQKHGGELRVESEVGVGSIFTVVLPAA